MPTHPPTWTIPQLARRLSRRPGELIHAIEEGYLVAAAVDPEILVTSEAITRWCGDPLEQRHWRVEDRGGRVQIIYVSSPGEAFLEFAGHADLDLPSHIPWNIPEDIDIREATQEDIRQAEQHDDSERPDGPEQPDGPPEPEEDHLLEQPDGPPEPESQ